MTAVYVGFNDCHLTEELQDAHGLAVTRESVRRLRCVLGRPGQRPRTAAGDLWRSTEPARAQ
jgi:hypothetical protein